MSDCLVWDGEDIDAFTKNREKWTLLLGVSNWALKDQDIVLKEWLSWMFNIKFVPGKKHLIRIDAFFEHFLKKHPEYRGKIVGIKFGF